MIITRPRDWSRILRNLDEIGARKVFLMGCGQCATAAHTGGQQEILQAKAALEQSGREVTGWTVGEIACHLGSTRLDFRKSRGAVEDADAVLVLSCGAGVQTVAEAVKKPVLPGLESVFLGNVIRHGVYEERCQMCGDCVLDVTAGICPVTTCPKGLLNGPCGGMWEGRCEIQRDRECTHVRIHRRLTEQQRPIAEKSLPPKDHSKKLKPGHVDLKTSAAEEKRSSKEGRL